MLSFKNSIGWSSNFFLFVQKIGFESFRSVFDGQLTSLFGSSTKVLLRIRVSKDILHQSDVSQIRITYNMGQEDLLIGVIYPQ